MESIPRHEPRWVYFAQRQSDGLVKIGVTTNVRQRMSSLACEAGSPVTLLGTVADDGWGEWRAHNLFRADRVRGEWFRPSPRLMEHIRNSATNCHPTVGLRELHCRQRKN